MSRSGRRSQFLFCRSERAGTTSRFIQSTGYIYMEGNRTIHCHCWVRGHHFRFSGYSNGVGARDFRFLDKRDTSRKYGHAERIYWKGTVDRCSSWATNAFGTAGVCLAMFRVCRRTVRVCVCRSVVENFPGYLFFSCDMPSRPPTNGAPYRMVHHSWEVEVVLPIKSYIGTIVLHSDNIVALSSRGRKTEKRIDKTGA